MVHTLQFPFNGVAVLGLITVIGIAARWGVGAIQSWENDGKVNEVEAYLYAAA